MPKISKYLLLFIVSHLTLNASWPREEIFGKIYGSPASHSSRVTEVSSDTPLILPQDAPEDWQTNGNFDRKICNGSGPVAQEILIYRGEKKL